MTTGEITRLVKTALIGELEQLRDEVKKIAAELTDLQLWKKPVEPGNSFGHLVLHLTGNLNHFVGAQLGKTGYLREREREFTETNPPLRDQLMANLDSAVGIFRRVVQGLDDAALASAHPESRFGTVLQTLTHLVCHFALHRGQMSYLVKLVKQ